MTDAQKQKHGLTDNIPLTASGQNLLARKQDARQPGESNAEFLARQAKKDPYKYGDTLRRQLESDAYFKALKEAEQMYKNQGLNIDYNDFNKQWEYQSKQRKKDIDRLWNSMMGR